ncbi:hypothetical protein [Solidesulfovibrio sp.]
MGEQSDSAVEEKAFDSVYGDAGSDTDGDAPLVQPQDQDNAAGTQVLAADGPDGGDDPDGDDDPGQEPDADADDDDPALADPSQLRGHARTTAGRLAAAKADKERIEAENQRLQDELEAARAGRSDSKAAGGDTAASDKPASVEIPEDLKHDVEEFDQQFPELSPLLRTAGPQGDRLRRVLRDSGADIAGIMAENMRLQALVSQGFEAVDARTEARTRQEHLERIGAEHPEVRGYATRNAEEAKAADAFLAGVTAWIETLPFKDATPRLEVLRQGSAGQVSELLAEYKQSTNKKPRNAELDPATKRRAAEAAGVDNRRGAQPRGDTTPRDKAEAAFEKTYLEA